MDDALDLPPPGKELGPAARLRYTRNFQATVGAADLVVCGNAELAARLPHERFEILPTPIDTERFHPGAVPPPERPTLGWVGHSDNLAYLESIAEPLREVRRRHPRMRLVVVADRAPQIPGLDIEFREWSLASEVSCFAGIGVGLMPLADTPWARAKCAFKAIQYMSLGIPAVASPVGMNVEVIRPGESGYLPQDGQGWVSALDALLSDHGLAARIGAEGRRTVLQDYSLEVLSRRLVGILRTVSDTTSSSSRRA
jgi:glycosyltransferase involved in cell wall biosynthesis